jgi:septum formation topological specificity factor MinE
LDSATTNCSKKKSYPTPEAPSEKEKTPVSNPPSAERRRLNRRNVSYYLPVLDNNTMQVIGHLIDISPDGLKIDTKGPVPTSIKYNLRLDLMEEIAGKITLEFAAESIWCLRDPIPPYLYKAGFQFINLGPGDIEVVTRIAEIFGG